VLGGLQEAPPVELVILDLRMPGEDGLVLARELRSRGDIAIIMLTASGETIDRVVGLEIGADDYMAKPFDPRELLARIRSVLRRTRPAAQASAPDPDPVPPPEKGVRFGCCLLDLASRQLFAPDGTEVPITAMQFDLMEAFLNHPNRVLSRDQLLELAHKRGDEPFDRSIDIRIARLRRKIEENPERPQTIKTVHGVGYIYVPSG
jgi:DNA-binding response OmpR family regulator